MKVWFMYDNHTFARIDESANRAAMEAQARKCFEADGCGSLFARDAKDHAIEDLHLHGRFVKNGELPVTDDEIRAFFGRVDEYENWEARG